MSTQVKVFKSVGVRANVLVLHFYYIRNIKLSKFIIHNFFNLTLSSQP